MSQIKVSGLDITKGTLNAINVTANAITPFGSLISGITESLKEDLDEMKEDILTTNLTQYFEQVSIMNKLILTKANDGTSIINKIQVRKIASNELKDPFPGRKEDLQGVTKKKIFKDYLDVACKPVTLPKEEARELLKNENIDI
ncbi:9021_t:CDS:2 [Gigaspora rosea]|nr:9021_t:CDS:2 [Gigaspora rosea]